MTLLLGMSKDEGIYMSADYRVTDARTGKLIDDASVKHLQVTYPTHNAGPKTLMAYTGLAILPDGTSTGAWIRETLRGESDVIDQSMAHVRERLDRDIAPIGVRRKVPLIVNVLMSEGQRRLVGGFSNLRQDGSIQPTFGYVIRSGPDLSCSLIGLGGAKVVTDGHLDQLRSQLNVRPRRVEDHMNLLATINRRVAAQESSVSAFCHVSYVNADDRTGARSRTFLEPGESVPFEMPVLLVGVDLTEMMRHFHEQSLTQFRGEKPGPEWDQGAAGRSVKRRP